MTREEKNQYVESMNDALCDLCTSYQDCNCLECAFARPISINGRLGTIIMSTDMGDWVDVAVAICDESGLVRLGDAKASDVADFANNYAEFDEEKWNDSPKCWWNEAYECWEEVLGDAT